MFTFSIITYFYCLEGFDSIFQKSPVFSGLFSGVCPYFNYFLQFHKKKFCERVHIFTAGRLCFFLAGFFLLYFPFGFFHTKKGC